MAFLLQAKDKTMISEKVMIFYLCFPSKEEEGQDRVVKLKIFGYVTTYIQ